MKLVHLILGGWLAVILVFLYGPIIVLGVSSFNWSISGSKWEGATGIWYRTLWYGSVSELDAKVGSGDAALQRAVRTALGWLGSESAAARLTEIRDELRKDPRRRSDASRITASVGPIINAMFNSLFIAAVATAGATVLGTAAAWLLHRFKYPLSRLLNTLVAVPMIVPEIIMGISLLILFATVDWPTGYLTVIVAHITFCFPYVMITIQARLAGLDPSLEEAAMDLGATPAVAFRKVIVPYLFPAIVSGALMAFTLSMDDFVVTYFTYSARAETFPIRVYGSIKYPNPLISTVSTVLVGLTAVLVVVSELLKRRS